MYSRYKDFVLDGIEYYGYTIISPDTDIIPLLKRHKAVSQYADGWYLDLPFVDVFDLYNPDDIKKNYLEIIHNAMFAKVSKGNYIAYWFNLIGNIPLLLYKYQIDIQWGKMHNIFNDILDLSLVYRGDMRTGQ